jgi:hypothetical protein
MEKKFVTNWIYVRSKEPIQSRSQIWSYGKKFRASGTVLILAHDNGCEKL